MSLLEQWLERHADALDDSSSHAEQVLPRLVLSSLPKIGVPAWHGGCGGDTRDAILAISMVAEKSLTAAFVLWAHRTFIELLLQSTNGALRERLLPGLLSGSVAGATGLSNAMKFLSGMEELRVHAAPVDTKWKINGSLAWASNLRREGFIIAAAVAPTNGRQIAVMALDSGVKGLERTADLDLLALRGSNTASVQLRDMLVCPADMIASDAQRWLPSVRPAFLGMQCGLSIGLARASLRQAADVSACSGSDMVKKINFVQDELEIQVNELLTGINTGVFQTGVQPLFRIRLNLAR